MLICENVSQTLKNKWTCYKLTILNRSLNAFNCSSVYFLPSDKKRFGVYSKK